jgi:tRNA(Arg) A34 adenosine deaminase TadA
MTEKYTPKTEQELTPNFKDYCLYLTLKHLKETSREDRSIVAASIYDTHSKSIYFGVSKMNELSDKYGMWNHAEYEALQLGKRHNVNPRKALVITTLSPCILDSSHRSHPSCTSILVKEGFKNVHVGKLDERQADIVAYREWGLEVTVTNNMYLRMLCGRLDTYFDPERSKRKMGGDKLAYIDEVLQDLPERWECD